ncbi:unnamed protein product [Phaedon cochleariae]|uniref:Uncharacterized protein n=1 Tax=Phaedon cochleariae TaxID=80249 RepID=A0A9P0GRD5_PHACE|nr:unnamed protein product [Phaedon cochleariae]
MMATNLTVLNETVFEDDPFAELDEAAIEQEELAASFAYIIVTILVKLAVCLAAIAADIFLVIMICRFRKLRSIRMNMFILNATILSVVYLLCTPLYFMLGHLLFNHNAPTLFLWQTQNTLLILYNTFAICMAVCWFLTGYKPLLIKKYQKYSSHVFGTIYIAFIIEWIFAFIYSKNHHIARMSIFTVFYVIFLVLLVILNVLKTRVSMSSDCAKTSYCLNVANIIFFAYLPMFLFHIAIRFISNDFMFYLEFIPELIALAHPVLIVYELGRKDKHFKTAYKKSFERQHEYEDDNLDEVSDNEIGDTRTNVISVDDNRQTLII